jgi:hypothetical protein
MWLLIVTITFAPVYDRPVQYSTYKIPLDTKEQCYVDAAWFNENYQNYLPATWPGAMTARCSEI